MRGFRGGTRIRLAEVHHFGSGGLFERELVVGQRLIKVEFDDFQGEVVILPRTFNLNRTGKCDVGEVFVILIMSVGGDIALLIVDTLTVGQQIAPAEFDPPMGARLDPGEVVADLGHLVEENVDPARLGARTRDFAYAARGLPAPAQEFRVELTAPGGSVWTFGPEGAEQRVTGPAADFCLLVTKRRHRADLRLIADGADADQWLDFAQAYAGPPSGGVSSLKS